MGEQQKLYVVMPSLHVEDTLGVPVDQCSGEIIAEHGMLPYSASLVAITEQDAARVAASRYWVEPAKPGRFDDGTGGWVKVRADGTWNHVGERCSPYRAARSRPSRSTPLRHRHARGIPHCRRRTLSNRVTQRRRQGEFSNRLRVQSPACWERATKRFRPIGNRAARGVVDLDDSPNPLRSSGAPTATERRHHSKSPCRLLGELAGTAPATRWCEYQPARR